METVILGNNIVSVRSIITREYDQAGSEAVYSVYKVQEGGWACLACWEITKPVVVSRCSAVHSSVDSIVVWLCV